MNKKTTYFFARLMFLPISFITLPSISSGMTFSTSQKVVIELFQAAYTRAPSALSSLDSWVTRYDGYKDGSLTGTTFSDTEVQVKILEEMTSGTESTAVFGSKTNSEKVDLIFTNSLGRTPESAGAEAWTEYAATVSLSQLIYDILNSARNNVDNVTLTAAVTTAEAALDQEATSDLTLQEQLESGATR